ncbi:MAG: hypothetical protein A2X13_04645 [Bacteroidetes bacterium GWC2_33_15]|nr:MAG: hypothetical protein A2X10_06490 [Bacteroidetes bacterium GWA2_33_15]OFX49819.1 MAG: hypothetical protein A2X13_04645 [Bacteroidetes bacterium GWC2_33_15]OFX65010.1 MAG: hypothetical protein A2X15_06565 [Bacteroidetes bacterium GWB2_32_14]OFX69028.1 MAG: hypothetical protein A2X14_13590 [Bacteroidetes bacterium GWD2_33_33]HAN18297.1 hypothetical protein [Bacteroidales bacterium]
MKKSVLLILFFISFTLDNSMAQIGVGEWRDHLPFSFSEYIARSSTKIYAATEYGILIYNKNSNAVEKLTKTNGLSDVGISSLTYSESYNMLFVGYSNGNIDLIKDRDIYNISDIKREVINGSKSINHILIIDEYAFLSCGFGIVVLNITKKEIKDTYFIGNWGTQVFVNQIAYDGQYIYAATNQGVYKGDYQNSNLVDFNNWILQTGIPNSSGVFNTIEIFNTVVFTNYLSDSSNDIVYKYSNTVWSEFTSDYSRVKKIKQQDSKLLLLANQKLIIYNTDFNPVDSIKTTSYSNPNISDALIDNNVYWLADMGNGLVKYSNSGVEYVMFNAPYAAESFAVETSNGKVLVSSGGISQAGGNVYINGMAHLFENQHWQTIFNYSVSDIVVSRFDPENNNHFYSGSWGYGLMEYLDNEILNTYNTSNSSLQSIITGENYVRIGGLAFDTDHNLWITNSEVANIISVKKANGEWRSYNYDDVISNVRVGDIVVTKDNNKWVVLPGREGLFVFNENQTIDNESDDSYKRISILDEYGKLITNDVYSIAEDLDGDIWVGTDQGIVVFFNPGNVFDESGFYAQRIVLTIDGITQYLLKTEVITAIAVDGANRKWIGTNSSGVYLISEDGTEEQNHFTEENSPLLSNRIFDIGIDHESGEVFFATEKGLISYRGTATMGNDEFSDVYAYPNPVRENYIGDITIRGLVSDVNVKITDISGNLVYETTAEGGQATWNGKNFSGQKVSTGVYLVFCTNNDGSKTHVTKLLVIK